MDRRNALQTIGATVAAGALGGHARAAESLPTLLRGVSLDNNDLKHRGVFGVNPHTGVAEQIKGRRTEVYLDGSRHLTCGFWVAADEAAGTVTVLVARTDENAEALRRKFRGETPARVLLPLWQHDPDPANPHRAKTQVLHGRVEIHYRWQGQEKPERLRGPLTVGAVTPVSFEEPEWLVDAHRELRWQLRGRKWRDWTPEERALSGKLIEARHVLREARELAWTHDVTT